MIQPLRLLDRSSMGSLVGRVLTLFRFPSVLRMVATALTLSLATGTWAQEANSPTQDATEPAASTPASPSDTDAPKPETEGPAAEVDAASASSKDTAALQFTFREQKWIDVLDWFARQADLSLVVNELPPGNFTYSDTKSYTPTEALDLLNGVLMTRGFALVRRERVLICANLKDGVPDGLVPRIELDDLDERGQFELVEVMFPLGKRPGAAVLTEIQPLVGAQGRATLLAETRQVLVTATAGKMRAIRAIIESIPEPQPPQPKPEEKPPAPVLTSYPVEGFEPGAATEMLKVLTPNAKLIYDKQTNQLNAFAVPSEQQAIAAFLKQIATDAPAASRPQLHVYTIQHPTPTALAEQLRLVVPTATISVDADPTRLIALATPTEHERLRDAIETLEAQGSDSFQQSPAVYSLRIADPTTVQTMVQALYPKVKVTVDPTNRRVVVIAPTSQQTTIRGLVEQLEVQRDNPLRIQDYALERLDPAQTQSVIQSLLPNLRMTVDNENRRLRVIGAQEEQAQVERLLEQLAQAAPSSAPRTIQRYPLPPELRERFQQVYRQLDPRLQSLQILDSGKPGELLVLGTEEQHGRVGAVLEQVKQQFPIESRRLNYYEVAASVRERFTTLRSQLAPQLGEIQIVNDANDPRLAILASESQHQQIQLLLDELAGGLPPETSQQLRVFAVTPTQRARFQAILPSMKDQLGSVRVLDEARPRELVVWGTAEQLEKINELLPTLQVNDTEAAQQLVVYPIVDGDPEAIQKVLAELYPDTKVLVDAESRRLMVWTTGEQQDQIAMAIKQLDAPAAAGKKRMAYYRMEQIDVREVVALFQRLLPEMSLVADRDSSSIIAWGSEADHATLAKTTEEFRQQQAAGARTVVSYDCGTVDVDRVRRLIDDLVPNARVVSDGPRHAIIVWATANDHQAVTKAMQEIVKGDKPDDFSMQVYPVLNVSADELVPVIEEMVPTAQVRSADDDKRLFVFANAAQQEQIRKAIDNLEKNPASLQRTVKTYDLERASAEDVRELIDETIREATLVSSDDPRRVIVQARPADHELIRSMIEQMEAAAKEPTQQLVRVYSVKDTPTETMQALIDPRLLQNMSVIPDRRRGALVVRGTEEQHKELAAAIEALLTQLPEPRRRISQVYRFQHADPTSLQTALVGLFPEATLAVDATTRSLIATAMPEEQERIRQAVTQLDQPTDSTLVTRTYRLRTSSMSSTREAIQALVPKAVLSTDFANRMLLATATPEDQQRIEEVVKQFTTPVENDRQTVVYRLEKADVDAAEEAIESLLPMARVVSDDDNRALLVTATADEHTRIADVIKQIDAAGVAGRQTRVYRLETADVEAAQEAIESLLPEARVVADRGNRVLLVTATDTELAQVADVVKELEAPVASQLATQAYHLNKGDVRAAREALQALFPQATFAIDRENRRLLVTATAEQQKQIAEVMQQLDQPIATDKELRAYRLEVGDVLAARDAIQALLPTASLSADATNRSLLVTASADEHARVAQVIAQLDRESQQQPTLVAYTVEKADVAAVLASLQQMYGRDPLVSLTADTTNGAILVKAKPREHTTIGQLIARMENGASQSSRRRLEVYSVPTPDATSFLSTIRQLFQGQQPAIELSLNAKTQQLVAVATPDQHETLKQAVSQIRGEPAVMEVFSLQSVDPFAVESAIERLYEGEPQRPIANSDSETQQLFVRGTQQQLKEVRELLAKMGELPNHGIQDQEGMRVIPFRGDVDDALEKLQQVWPTLRSNRIEVIRPSSPSRVILPEMPAPPPEAPPEPESDAVPPADQEDQRPNANDGAARDIGSLDPFASRYVSTDLSSSPQANEPSTDAAARPDDGQTVAPAVAADAAKPPVVILPGPGAITVMSDDVEALQQAESLLRTIARQDLDDASAGNFAVFSLRNAGARAVAKLLEQLFEQMPITTRATLGRVSMVADDRLNAVVVHGRPADRAVIAELLRVLDSSNVPDSLANARPLIVPLEHLDAPAALTILRSIYKTQLESGGRQPEIEIPEGISSEVATVLQQMNAINSGPLLTLEVDTVTNSVIILAPRQLVEEVAILTRQLDKNASEMDRREIGIISLKDTNVGELQNALRALVRPLRGRR